MTREEFLRSAEEADFEIMEEHRRRVEELVADPATAGSLKPYYRYICKRPCFHDEYLQAFNNPNVTLVDCPAGIDKVTEKGPVVDGKQYEVDCIIYGTGFEAERTPLYRRVGHLIIGRGGVTLADRWADGPLTLFGMMSRGFPNMFVMPGPGQQCVVTVNYTQLAVLGAEFVGTAVELLQKAGVEAFDVSAEAEDAWVQGIIGQVPRHHTGHVRLHAVAHQQRGPPRGREPEDGQLRRRLRRLVRLPRGPRELARRRSVRGPGARRAFAAPREQPVSTRRPVAVVTGGAGGIGASIAEALGRGGWYVVTVDPLVTLDGTEQLPEPEDSTAARIVAAGGSARASSTSVTDAAAVRALFEELADDHGGLDAVVNVAGITRQSYFARGTEEDWVALLNVHLGGYLNVLDAALPLMAEAGARPHPRGHLGLGLAGGGRGRVQRGQASRGGADLAARAGGPAGGDRQRALTDRQHPDGGGGAGTGASRGPCRGWGWALAQRHPGPGQPWPPRRLPGRRRVRLVQRPGLLRRRRPRWPSSIRPGWSRSSGPHDVVSLRGVLETTVPRAFVTAETNQATDGGANPRFGSIFDEPAPSELLAGDVRSCAIVSERPELTAALVSALEARSIAWHTTEPARDFDGAAKALRATAEASGSIDAVLVALAGPAAGTALVTDWRGVLADHRELVEHLHADASWTRAVADYAAGTERPVRMVTLTDATTPAGRSRAQAAAQIARAAAGGTGGRVTALAASVESAAPGTADQSGELVGHLLGHPEAVALAGAELVVGSGWIGLRAHPRPIGTVVYGGPAIPGWMDGVLRELVDPSRPGVGPGAT